MENASKALLIAAGVLIAILLLTLFSYLFGRMAESSSKFYSMMEEHEIAEFNQQFLNYKGRGVDVVGHDASGNPIYNDMTVQDVVTIVNLAKDNNKNKKRLTKVEVYVDSGTGREKWSEKKVEELNDLLKTNIGNKYKCSNTNGIVIDTSTKLVKEVNISIK